MSTDLLAALQRAVTAARLQLPTKDQSYCDLLRHQQCSGYTEDEADPETCMCDCHGTPAPEGGGEA